MMRKIVLVSYLLICLISIQGCTALVAGVAVGVVGGAGTATWLANKLVTEVDVGFKTVVESTKQTMLSQGFELEKVTQTPDTAQIMSEYNDKSTIWIDIHKISDMKTKISVRVGIPGDKEHSREIMNYILESLDAMR